MCKNIINVSSLFFVILCLNISLFSGCKKNDVSTQPLQTDSIYDIDSNVYRTIKIGSQWWMAQNLQVTRYRNGKSLLDISNNNSSVWDSSLTKGAYCLFGYGNSGSTLGDSTGSRRLNINMGFLYNCYAATDTNNIAPKGWHVATDDDWQQMETYLGMNKTDVNATGWRGTNQANKLRYKSYGWQTSDNQYLVYGTNESGFSALGGGCRMFKLTANHTLWGDYDSPGYDGYWWTATQHPDSVNCSWYRNLNYNTSKVFRFYAYKSYGFSIRCVKDK